MRAATRWQTLGWLCATLACAPVAACAQEPARAARAAEPDRWRADLAAAEALSARGNRAGAAARARAITQAFEQGGARTGSEYVSAGRAYVLQRAGNAEAMHAALRLFDRAVAMDSGNLEAQRQVGAIFFASYAHLDAKATFEAVLKRAPGDAGALLGLARIEEYEGKGTTMLAARRALAADDKSAEALAFTARLLLEAETFDSARTYAQRAVQADSARLEGWSILAATAWVTGDSAGYRQALAAATALTPTPSGFYAELADAAVRQRRYDEAVQLAQRAVSLDSLDARAWGVLGTTQLRVGTMDAGRASVETAFRVDPFNLWHKNTLDLLDKMRGFRTVSRGRFTLVAPEKEVDLLALYMLPLLERAFDSLSVRYGYKPPTPVRIEFYDIHADFSVRTVGLNGLGALGVSFGSLLAMDAPGARTKGEFNWGSTAWHELTHAFTLGASAHRVPRWISEGLSVVEERRAAPGWGARASLPWLVGMNTGQVRRISELSEGFLRPRSPMETQNSYFQASMFCEWVELTKGAKALPALLVAYRDGLDTPGAFRKVLGLTPQQVDVQFDAWVRQRFAKDLASAQGMTPTDSAGNRFVRVMRAAVALVDAHPDSARRLLEEARGMMPEYAADDGPAWYLARIALAQRDTAAALDMVSIVTRRDETAWEANRLEAALREAKGDRAGAMAALERLLWIWPYDEEVHKRLATLAAAQGDRALAVRERQAVIALRPTDLLDARYELARALAAAGDVAAARRELLAVLEEAPGFERAQTLLLELRRGGGR
ncbi:MAG: tetratricopeptide repeat protein [Gemmatimonadetes bacterium]|nr:tetratricopeptide repeat protein [Gemmatimonadota bacterium]